MSDRNTGDGRSSSGNISTSATTPVLSVCLAVCRSTGWHLVLRANSFSSKFLNSLRHHGAGGNIHEGEVDGVQREEGITTQHFPHNNVPLKQLYFQLGSPELHLRPKFPPKCAKFNLVTFSDSSLPTNCPPMRKKASRIAFCDVTEGTQTLPRLVTMSPNQVLLLPAKTDLFLYSPLLDLWRVRENYVV